MIQSSWGGTYVQTWISQDVLSQYMKIPPYPATVTSPNTPSVLFNGMINPLLPFTIRGALWYQGESNVGDPDLYAKLFPAMIGDWRTRFGVGDFPFYFVQIAPYSGYHSGERAARLREAQTGTLALKNMGMAVTTDITSDPTNIHPTDKLDVGNRLAYWALNKTYRQRGVVFSGPLYHGMRVEGNKIRIFFDHTDGGLKAGPSGLSDFSVAGSDHVFHPATAVIEGKTLVVSSPDVSRPEAARFGWSDVPVAWLFNGAGLPASPFRTDSF
jgi:sialate O-acetylesterase